MRLGKHRDLAHGGLLRCNAVLNVASAKQMIEVLALMGYSTFELTWKVPIQIERRHALVISVELMLLKSYRK